MCGLGPAWPVTPPEIGWQLLDSAEVNKTNAKLGRRANKVLDAIFSGSGHVVTRTHRTPPGPLTPIHGATLLRPQGASATRWIIRDFFNIQTFAEMTILFGINCENISMALHRTKLRDLAETAKVVSGRKFIRNSGEICSLHHKIEDRWARSYSGQASPDLRLSLWLCTKPHSSIAIQLKRSKSSISFWTEKLFYQGFPRSKQLDCETMSFITQAVMVGTGDTQQRIL